MRAQPGSAEDAGERGEGSAHCSCSVVPAEGSGEIRSMQSHENVGVAQTTVKSGP